MSRGGTTVETRVVIAPDAVVSIERLAMPYLRQCAKTIGQSIVEQVPVHRGVVKRSYRPRVVDGEPGEVRLHPGSPFWHWLEYGTATTPVYRPVARGVQASGARWEPS